MKILYYLVLIRLRKFLPKNDKSAIVLLLVFLLGMYYLLYENFNILWAVLLTDPVAYHLKRKDVSFLKNRFFIFLEYFIYIFPLFLVFVLNGNYYSLLFFPFVFLVTYIPKFKIRYLKLPFVLFSPIWHVGFRKYKGYVFLLLAKCFLGIGCFYNNENLTYFSIVVLLLFPVVIYFDESILAIHHSFLPYSKLRNEEFLLSELKNHVVNVLVYASIYIILYLILNFTWSNVLVLFVAICLSSTLVLFKYYSENRIISALFFSVFVGGFLYGSILLLPIIYFKALKKIKHIHA